MIRLYNSTFFTDPYPIGIAKDVFDMDYYQHLCESYPSEKLFAQLTGAYYKYSLSEVNNSEKYMQFIKQSASWRTVYSYIKDPWFAISVLKFLKSRNIPVITGPHDIYKSRFEFSSLPADGGFILPHRDIPSKIITLIIPMILDSSLQEDGTEVLRPLYSERIYQDYKMPLTDFERVHRFPFTQNSCVVFVKSDTSWHSVGPFTGPENIYRRSLTINIERVKQ